MIVAEDDATVSSNKNHQLFRIGDGFGKDMFYSPERYAASLKLN
jgi:hypothetical protein